MRRSATSLALAGLLTLAACGGGGGGGVDSASSDEQDPTASAPTAAPEEEPKKDDVAGEIIRTGFGQRDEFVWVTSLVKNLGDEAGATVSVQYNAKDAAGTILVSETQVESFSRGGETIAVGTQLTVPGSGKVATVDATLLVEPDGIGTEFPEIPVGPVTVGKDEFGGFSATFEITNPTAEPLSSPRIGVVCYDAAEKIIGGTSEFPDLVPPNGKARVATNGLLVSGQPAKCEAYAGGPL